MSNAIELFFELVRIDSESGEEKVLIDRVKALFEEELHADCLVDDYGNLIGRLAAKGSEETVPILLCAHADTVKPGRGVEPVMKDGVMRSAGETILGADDKAGIVEIFEALRTATKRPPVEIVVTRGEEIGLLGVKNLDLSKLQASMGFVLDGDELDEIVIGGPTYVAVDAEIIGKAAHAGMEPEKGISAIRVAARAIMEMPEGRIDSRTTVNIGVIDGGEIRNGVPKRARLKGECRSLDHDKCLRQAETMKRTIELAASEAGATANVVLTMTMHAAAISEDEPIVSVAKKAIEAAGLKPKTRIIVGGTDASILNEKGIMTVVLGFGGRNAHSSEEEIAIADMEKAIRILRNLLESVA